MTLHIDFIKAKKRAAAAEQRLAKAHQYSAEWNALHANDRKRFSNLKNFIGQREAGLIDERGRK